MVRAIVIATALAFGSVATTAHADDDNWHKQQSVMKFSKTQTWNWARFFSPHSFGKPVSKKRSYLP